LFFFLLLLLFDHFERPRGIVVVVAVAYRVGFVG